MEMPTKFTREALDEFLEDMLAFASYSDENVTDFVEYIWKSNTQNIDSPADLVAAIDSTIRDLSNQGAEEAYRNAEISTVYTEDTVEYFAENCRECIALYEGNLEADGLLEAISSAVIAHKVQDEMSEQAEVEAWLKVHYDHLAAEYL